jgi:hypothetical protein
VILNREVTEIIGGVFIVLGVWGLLAVIGAAVWSMLFRAFRRDRR